MTRDGESESPGNSSFDLGEFIEEKSSLFLVMGVFAGLAIYISQAPTGESLDDRLVVRTGFVSAFLLSIFILLKIYSMMARSVGSWRDLFKAHRKIENYDLMIFTILVWMLLHSIGYILLQHEPVIFILLLMVSMIMAYVLFLAAFEFTISLSDGGTMRNTIATFLLSFGIIISVSIIDYEVFSGQEMTTLYEFTLSDPLPGLTTILRLSLLLLLLPAVVGVVVSVVSFPFIIIGYIREIIPKAKKLFSDEN